MTRELIDFRRICTAIFVLLVIVVTGSVVTSPGWAAGSGGASEPSIRNGCYYDLPQITANLRTDTGQSRFMSLHLSVCVHDEETAHYLQRIQPRVLDSIQPFLRDTRLGDLHGAAGMYRLRNGLLTRIRAAAAPMAIDQVVFREILVD